MSQIQTFKKYSDIKKQQTFLNLHIFEEYKSTDGKLISILDVIDFPKDKDELQTKVFVFAKSYIHLFENKFFKIKVNQLDGDS